MVLPPPPADVGIDEGEPEAVTPRDSDALGVALGVGVGVAEPAPVAVPVGEGEGVTCSRRSAPRSGSVASSTTDTPQGQLKGAALATQSTTTQQAPLLQPPPTSNLPTCSALPLPTAARCTNWVPGGRLATPLPQPGSAAATRSARVWPSGLNTVAPTTPKPPPGA